MLAVILFLCLYAQQEQFWKLLLSVKQWNQCSDNHIFRKIGLYVFVFVCVWASRSVARAACPEHCANTYRGSGREEEEERVIELEANEDIQPIQSET